MKKPELNIEKKENKSHPLWFRVTEDEYIKIKKLADKKKVLVSTMMRAFVSEFLKKI